LFRDIEIICVHSDNSRSLLRLKSSIRLYLGNIKMRVIDGSGKKERRVLKAMMRQGDPFFTVEFHKEKLQQGIDLGIRTSLYSYVLVINPNIRIKEEAHTDSLIKEMRRYARSSYGVGHVSLVQGIPYLHPMCMMINKKEYLKWPAFEDGEMGCMKAMVALAEANKSGNVVKLKNSKSYWTSKTT